MYYECMFFSVIIPTYNRAEILKETLEALMNQSVSKKDYEVIVVNDGSTDSTEEVVLGMCRKHKNISYLAQENQGQGIARNAGLEKAQGKVVVIIGDDIIPTHDFLFEHQKFHYLHEEENAGVLGFTTWHPRLKLNSFMKWSTNGSSVLGMFGGHQFAYEKLRGRELADFNFFYTSNISLKRSLLEKYPFDNTFSGYGWEDIELGYRLEKKAGFKLYYNSWAVAYHDHFMDETAMPKRMESIGKSAWIFHNKYPELKKVPSWWKGLLFQVMGSKPVILFLKFLRNLSGDRFYCLYFYCLSKRHFMIGIKKGKKLYYNNAKSKK